MARKVKILRDGELADVAPAEAESDLRAGKASLIPGTEIAIVGPDSQVAYIPAERVPRALTDGYRLAESREIAMHEAEKSPMMAFTENAVNDALPIPGLGHAAQRLFGADPEDLDARSQTLAGRAGTLTGFGASLLGPAVVKGIASPMKYLIPGVAAEGAERALRGAAERAIGRRIESEVARKAVAGGFGSAAVGAGIGMGGAVDEAALGNPDIGVQELALGAGLGGLVGGAVGGGMSAWIARKAVKGRMPVDDLAAAAAASGDDELADAVKGKWYKQPHIWATRKLFGEEAAQDLEKVYGPRARALIGQGEKAFDDSAESVSKLLDDLEGAHVDPRGVSRDQGPVRDAIARQVPDSYANQAFDEARDLLTGARAHMTDLVDNASQYGKTPQAVVNALNPGLDLVEQGLRRLNKLEVLNDAGKLPPPEWVKAAGKHRKGGKFTKAPLELKVDPKELVLSPRVLPATAGQVAFREVEHAYRGLAELTKKLKGTTDEAPGLEPLVRALSDSLGDDTVWGPAGRMYKRYIEAVGEAEATRTEVQKYFKPDSTGKMNRGAVRATLKDVERVKNDGRISAIDRWVDSQRKFAETSAELFPDSRDLVVQARGRQKQHEEMWKRLREDVGALNALGRLRKLPKEIGLPMNRFGAAAVGSAIGGFISHNTGIPGGALLGGLAGHMLSDPGRTAAQIGSLANFRDRTVKAMGSRVERMLGITAPDYKWPMRQSITRSTIDMLEGDTAEKRRAAFDQRVVEIQALSNPQVYAQHIETQLADMDGAPKHQAAIAAKGGQVLAWLAGRIPEPEGTSPSSALGQLIGEMKAGHPSDRKIHEFAELDRIAQDPSYYLELAEKGLLRAVHVEALQELYPVLDQRMRTQLAHSLPHAKKLTPAKRRSIQVIMGNDVISPQQASIRAGVFEQPIAPPPQGGPPPSGPSSAGRAVASETDSLSYGAP